MKVSKKKGEEKEGRGGGERWRGRGRGIRGEGEIPGEGVLRRWSSTSLFRPPSSSCRTRRGSLTS